MKTSAIIGMLVSIAVIVGIWFWMDKNASPQSAAVDYKNATYVIDGQPVTLVNDRAETPAAPGSASKIVTQYFGNEAAGDLDGDRQDDIAFILTQDRGGSGTFFYAAAALKTADGYRGTNAILLGDRVAPQTTEIRNGLLIANYADRAQGEPMTARPSVGVSKYLTLADSTLKEIAPLSKGEQVSFGYLTIGHEVRSFRPCGEGQPEYWLSGDSPALDELKGAYAREVSDVPPSAYTPLFAVLAGRITDTPADGFGADYAHALRVSELIRADREESCKSDMIIVTSPRAGAAIASPLTVEGYARGPWYFEASFPLILTDWDGKIIAEGYATAQGEWMTESFVPFNGTLEFKKPEAANGFSRKGTLIFKKDNPSGMPEKDDSMSIPVGF
ncbi:hypothetical protein A3F27_00040 [Candidatus Kaiserbacteria bacterium RIFCSPHIGHO2_12_FULL_53_13]|uniref:Bacterial spore germination immunoglobulin-like domain-containing protein n=1 Tax=Candidatus Kaiserbacteria bacterium RIFCSPHIGHO2_12_FULL_53_13 TaxID=1798502 RepID=A0A1F6EC69_9BACT|nr:MAG: hypothetical protein A3F27_00040 [Candidatus Kaiserbacteria bacterium RIFCSPHIGHO2_12_FULL_53_13]OGG74283.1 MAG: hypothetical protein A3A37_03105 [Candidatus Kaiserbacteria bacterium RIFCSPLOWO2_01_FULL_52_36]